MDKLEYQKGLALRGLKYTRPRPEQVTLPKDHPLYCMTYKGRVAKARIVMAEHLGRPLTRNEIVRYRDDFPLNIDISNLELRDRQYIWDSQVELGTEVDAKQTEAYQLGKKEEERVAVHLSSIGYSVSDISRTRHYNLDGTVTYSPFDIYAWSEKYSFLADVKYRSSKGDIHFDASLSELYKTYWTQIPVNSRIIIVVTPGLADSFASINDTIVYDNRRYHTIARSRTYPITTLRILAEGGDIQDNRRFQYLHLKPNPKSPAGYDILGYFPYPQEK